MCKCMVKVLSCQMSVFLMAPTAKIKTQWKCLGLSMKLEIISVWSKQVEKKQIGRQYGCTLALSMILKNAQGVWCVLILCFYMIPCKACNSQNLVEFEFVICKYAPFSYWHGMLGTVDACLILFFHPLVLRAWGKCLTFLNLVMALLNCIIHLWFIYSSHKLLSLEKHEA